MNGGDSDTKYDNICKASVESSTRITPKDCDEVRQLVLRIDEVAFRYVSGQSIGILVPGPHPFGNKYHHRRYSIANPVTSDSEESIKIELLVKRCFYIDEVSGEQIPGIASNYLCDLAPGQTVKVTGPYRSPFKIPLDKKSNLLMIGTGTGIAPFRAFVKQIYVHHGHWNGQVRLFYGDRGGMDLLYGNVKDNDLAHYYDEETFKAFQAMTDNPLSSVGDALENSLADNAQECAELLRKPNTYVYIAGQQKAADVFDKVMAESFDSEEDWNVFKTEMSIQNRWGELLY